MKKVNIDKELCIGCGSCTTACHNGVIEIIDGKAEIVRKDYCDGLGLCLPDCPSGAISVVDEIEEDKENAIKDVPHVCPGSQARTFRSDVQRHAPVYVDGKASAHEPVSELSQWPVQLRLISPRADYLQGADILVAADCTAYAYAKFHRTFIKNHITIIACPKLDDNDYNTKKLAEIFGYNEINTVTIVKMAVPCCGGIARAVRQALVLAGKDIPVREETISPSGELL